MNKIGLMIFSIEYPHGLLSDNKPNKMGDETDVLSKRYIQHLFFVSLFDHLAQNIVKIINIVITNMDIVLYC